MIKVSIHQDIEFYDIAEQYAHVLQNWKNGGALPTVFGNEGQWEDNKRLMDSFIFKIHIKLPNEAPWSKKMPAAARKSNSYLVYSRHFLYPDQYQLISIMTPNAHELARTSYTGELERRAEQFQSSF
ncbi:type II toxin-antitoxin system YafO family toxin [Serratia ureilytica]|uniref:type II toxin-antitoxin system YafO family toxin n=1 Tax=Serratia TaxID=613 RepID=UPI0018E822AF|nr:type II toxin-antitoxin system YafO family toxin [Serratia ureilytica]MBJ2093863.1 type II toxin-antitoxin system YafO family toxin [Serratia ureilytica]MBN5375614.1 type II toxin-antitoxin system YafO family toxin [Serratia marcescens]HBK4690044.1 type II toxin-antitoxin system YafO family toxin [Serratia marcescens]